MLIWQNLPIYSLKALLLKISTCIQSWNTIVQKMREIEHWNQFSTWIKGNNSVIIWRNLSIFNPKPLLLNTNSHAKFAGNWPKNARDRALKPIFYTNQGQWLCAKLTKFIHLQINSYTKIFTGPLSIVGNLSGHRCVSDCRSRGHEFDPCWVPYFRGD